MSSINELEDFYSYIASEKGLAINTLEAYKRDTQSLASYLEGLGISRFDEVLDTHIIGYLSHLKQQGYAISSLTRALVSIKVLFRFLKRER